MSGASDIPKTGNVKPKHHLKPHLLEASRRVWVAVGDKEEKGHTFFICQSRLDEFERIV